MKRRGTLETSDNFYQEVYSVSMNDLVDIWVETFHPFGTVLVLFDVGNYFKTLQDCGILCSQLNAYSNKILTISLPGVDTAFEVMDTIKDTGLCPIMYVYDNGKMILDNIEP